MVISHFFLALSSYTCSQKLLASPLPLQPLHPSVVLSVLCLRAPTGFHTPVLHSCLSRRMHDLFLR